MNIRHCIFFLCVLNFTPLFSQMKDWPIKRDPPSSIYTLHVFSQPSTNNFRHNASKIHTVSYQFVYVDLKDIDYNVFSFRFENIGKIPSSFIYDDYRRYQDRNLLKGFLLKNDPTRWNLHRVRLK